MTSMLPCKTIWHEAKLIKTSKSSISSAITKIWYSNNYGLFVSWFDGRISWYSPVIFEFEWEEKVKFIGKESQYDSRITTMALSEQLKVIAIGAMQGEIFIFDVATLVISWFTDSIDSEVQSLMFDNDILISLHLDNRLVLWNADNLTKVKILEATALKNRVIPTHMIMLIEHWFLYKRYSKS